MEQKLEAQRKERHQKSKSISKKKLKKPQSLISMPICEASEFSENDSYESYWDSYVSDNSVKKKA